MIMQKKITLVFWMLQFLEVKQELRSGTLTVMIGGDKKDYDKASPIISCYSKKMKLLGKAGKWPTCKNGKSNLYSWIWFRVYRKE